MNSAIDFHEDYGRSMSNINLSYTPRQILEGMGMWVDKAWHHDIIFQTYDFARMLIFLWQICCQPDPGNAVSIDIDSCILQFSAMLVKCEESTNILYE